MIIMIFNFRVLYSVNYLTLNPEFKGSSHEASTPLYCFDGIFSLLMK